MGPFLFDPEFDPDGGQLWGSNEAPVHQAWTELELEQQMQDCSEQGGTHHLTEARNHQTIPEEYGGGTLEPGDVYVTCLHTGVIYSPPLHWLLLEDLLYPEAWTELDWPGIP